jgi:hypothetical protein
MRESKLEYLLKSKIESMGGICLKITSPGTRGVPDRLVIVGNLASTQCIFVELKAPKGKLSISQKRFKDSLETKCGVEYVVIDSLMKLVIFLSQLKQFLY